jgi:hypothetical protein
MTAKINEKNGLSEGCVSNLAPIIHPHGDIYVFLAEFCKFINHLCSVALICGVVLDL